MFFNTDFNIFYTFYAIFLLECKICKKNIRIYKKIEIIILNF